MILISPKCNTPEYSLYCQTMFVLVLIAFCCRLFYLCRSYYSFGQKCYLVFICFQVDSTPFVSLVVLDFRHCSLTYSHTLWFFGNDSFNFFIYAQIETHELTIISNESILSLD